MAAAVRGHLGRAHRPPADLPGYTDNLDFEWIQTNWLFILAGAGLTVVVSVASIILATILAVFGALGRLSRSPVLNGIASLYVSLVRGTPLIVQIFFIFFALPQVGIVLPAIPTGVIALGVNYGAYMTEIFRAGLQAVPRGQREAAQALGMSERLVFRRIVRRRRSGSSSPRSATSSWR